MLTRADLVVVGTAVLAGAVLTPPLAAVQALVRRWWDRRRAECPCGCGLLDGGAEA